MSLLSEYVKLGWKGLHNLPNIAEGFYNAILEDFDKLSEQEKQEAKSRLESCTNCIFSAYKAKELDMYETVRQEPHCSICGCLTKKKMYAFSDSCPLADLVVKDKQVFQLGGDPYTNPNVHLWFVSSNPIFYEELLRIAEGGETVEINGEKYIHLKIKRKFDQWQPK